MDIFNKYLILFQISTIGMSSLPTLNWGILLIGALNILFGFLKYCAKFHEEDIFIDKIVSFKHF